MDRVTRRWLGAALAVLLLGGGIIIARAAAESGNSFRFSIIGDRTGGATPGVYSQVWREVDQLHPDFVVTVGDTIQRTNDPRRQWDRLRPLFDRYRHYPIYFTAGNHDVFSEESRVLFEKETGRPTFYSFDHQNAHFTVLDNSRTLDLSDEQLLFLEEDLEEQQDKSPKFIFFHKPFWILPLKLGSGEFPLHRIAKKYGVDYVISGHGHQFMRMERDGIVYLEVGSSGGRMRGVERGLGFREGWFYHHVLVSVEGAVVTMTVKELDEPFGKGRTFPAGKWGTARGMRSEGISPMKMKRPGRIVGAGLAPPATRAPNPGAASDAPTDYGAKVGAARAGILEGSRP